MIDQEGKQQNIQRTQQIPKWTAKVTDGDIWLSIQSGDIGRNERRELLSPLTEYRLNNVPVL